MKSVATLWQLHRAAELENQNLEDLDPVATALIAFHDGARTIALAIERGELTPEDVCAEVDQTFLQIQDLIEAQQAELSDLEQESSPQPANDSTRPET